MTDLWWVYVIDHERKRFAVGPLPVNDATRWHEKVEAARLAGNRQLESGAIATKDAQTLTGAVAAVKAMARGLEQFEPRVIFAAMQPDRRG